MTCRALNQPQGFTSNVTILFAAGFTLPSFFFLYAARLAAFCSLAASSSDSELPNRSSSSSSAAAAGVSFGLRVVSLFSGPYAEYALDGSPGRDENSEAYEER